MRWNSTMIGQPKYSYNCDRCVYLGDYHSYSRLYDLYVHTEDVSSDDDSAIYIDHLVAVDEHGHYQNTNRYAINSCHDISNPLTVALARALYLGYEINPNNRIVIYNEFKGTLLEAWRLQEDTLGDPNGAYLTSFKKII